MNRLIGRFARGAGLLCALTALVLPLPALALRPVDETRPAPTDGVVDIENLEGTVTVTGWDREEVQVKGTLGDGPERLEITQEGKRTRIKVVWPKVAWPKHHKGRGDESTTLTVQMPRKSGLEGEAVSCDFRVSGVEGDLNLEAVSGDIHVTGGEGHVDLETVSGDITTEGAFRGADVEAVSGDISMSGVKGKIKAETVSGDIRIRTGAMEQVKATSVSGDVNVDGEPEGTGTYEFESHSGDVTLSLPSSVSAEFDLSTFSGDIENDFGQTPERTSRHGPGEELQFTVGRAEARIKASSFSGTVHVAKRGT